MQHYLFLIFLFYFFPSRSCAFESVTWETWALADQHQLAANEYRTLAVGRFAVELHHQESSLLISTLGAYSSGSPTAYYKDVQVVSNIDVEGHEAIKLYELRYKATLGSSTALSVGWQDLSKTFNITDAGKFLVHSSFGTDGVFGNTGSHGPSIYPTPSFGLSVHHRFDEKHYLLVAVADPIGSRRFVSKQLQTNVQLDAENHLAVVEVGLEVKQQYKFGLGLWNYVGEGASSAPFRQSGAYLMYESRINRYVQPFLRLGTGSREVNRIFWSIVPGVRLWMGECCDHLIEVGWAGVAIDGRRYNEEVAEIMYRYKAFSFMSFALSYQRITNSGGGSPDYDLVTLRLGLEQAGEYLF